MTRPDARVHHRLAGRPLALAADPRLLAEEIRHRRQLREAAGAARARPRPSCAACARRASPAATSRSRTRRRPSPPRPKTMPAARAMGAANTLWFEGDRLVRRQHRRRRLHEPSARLARPRFDAARIAVAVLGAGGAARGIVHALLEAGAPEVRIFNRTRDARRRRRPPFRRARRSPTTGATASTARATPACWSTPPRSAWRHAAALDMPLAQLDRCLRRRRHRLRAARDAAARRGAGARPRRPSTASACCCTRPCPASRSGSA